jgi:hypothetical protein
MAARPREMLQVPKADDEASIIMEKFYEFHFTGSQGYAHKALGEGVHFPHPRTFGLTRKESKPCPLPTE